MQNCNQRCQLCRVDWVMSFRFLLSSHQLKTTTLEPNSRCLGNHIRALSLSQEEFSEMRHGKYLLRKVTFPAYYSLWVNFAYAGSISTSVPRLLAVSVFSVSWQAPNLVYFSVWVICGEPSLESPAAKFSRLHIILWYINEAILSHFTKPPKCTLPSNLQTKAYR